MSTTKFTPKQLSIMNIDGDDFDFESERTWAGRYFVSPNSSIIDHSVDVDGSLASLIAKIDTSPGVIEFPPNCNYNYASSIVIPSNITLKFNQGSILVSSNGSADLTINGSIEAGLCQIFSGDGSVIMSSTILAIYPQWWGALANGSHDDTAAFQSAIDCATLIRGAKVLVPIGTYITTSSITVKANVVISGDARGGQGGIGSKINGVTKTFPIFICMTDTLIENLKIVGGSVGVSMNTAHWSRVKNCRISENRIGMLLTDPYITSINENFIANNDYGIVLTGRSYETVIQDNIIDNNYGGCGILVIGANGCIIKNNTIEGNRNTTTGEGGVGLFITGSNQRIIVDSNWFEGNYGTTDADLGADVIVGVHSADNAIVASIITNAIPTEYQASIAGAFYTLGQNVFSNNYHFGTKYGYIINKSAQQSTIIISNPTFVGILDKYNIGIYLIGASNSYTTIRIKNVRVVNTAQNGANAQMLIGINDTCVFNDGDIPNYEAITLDGKDLFTKEMSMYEFSQLPGATLSCDAITPSFGTATYTNDVRCSIGTIGVRSVIGTGRARATDSTGDPNIIPIGSVIYGIALKVFNGIVTGISYTYSLGTSYTSSTDARYFNINKMLPPTTAVGTYYTGDYFGYCYMSEADYETNFAGTRRLKLTDLIVYGNV